jgi:hypothetical protein
VCVEAAVRRQFISARRPSRDSRYAAFLSIHCAYTLVAHTCVITVTPHMWIQIYCTVLNCLPYCLVVYASATCVTLYQSEGQATTAQYISILIGRARICKGLWSPDIDSKELISPGNVAWRAGTTNRVAVPSHQAGNRFLGSLKGLQIRAQLTDNMFLVGGDPCMRKGCRVHIRSKVVVGDDAVLASTGLPPDLKAGGLEVWSVWRSAVACGLSGDWSWNSSKACKNPWRLATGKRLPAWFSCVRQGEVYPAGRHSAPRRKIPKGDGGRQRTPGPGLPRRRCGLMQGFSWRVDTLSLFVADVQGEMVQGSAKDGIGAVIERRDMAVPLDEHHRRVGQGVWQL